VQGTLLKGLTLLLWYLGIFAALPAPEGWETFGGGDLTLHLPPGWEKVDAEGPLPTDSIAGFEPALTFAPGGPRRPSDPSVIVGLVPHAAKIGDNDEAALLSLQVDRPGMVARALARELPGWSCSVATTVFDQARHRLWFRIEAHKEGEPPRAFVFVVFLTRVGAIYFQTAFPVEDGDEAFLDSFRQIVDSFEMKPSIRLRGRSGRLGANPSSPYRIGFEVGRDFGRRHPAVFQTILVLLSLGLLLTLLDPVLFRRRLKASLLRRLQRKASSGRALAPVGVSPPPRSPWRPPLPVSLGWQIALAHLLAFAIVPWFPRSPQLYGVRLFGACYLVGYGLLATAVALHYVPRTSRRLKYELLAAALSTLALPGTLSDPVLQAIAVGCDLPSLEGLFWGNFLSQTVYFYLAGVVVGYLLRGPRAARRAARFYRATYWLKRYLVGLVSISPWLPVGGLFGLGFALLVALYRMGEKAREHPILFLRSFQDRGASLVLAKIIMPTAGRFAPVVAVAHARQPPEELYRKTSLVTAAQLTTLPDTAWQEWIVATLPACRAVVIDTSVESEGLLWEREQAHAALPVERIAVLAQGKIPGQERAGLFALSYRLDWRGYRAARKALRAWLRALPPVA